MRLDDTIVSPVSAAGGAIGAIRLSGSRALLIVSQVFSSWQPDPVSHTMVYGQFVTGDDGYAVCFLDGRSYTGELSVEMFVHGSRASMSSLVESCLDAGARLADPGEFSYRAFMNGRIDLSQAEGVRDTILAETQLQLQQATRLKVGDLKRVIDEARSKIMSVLAQVEAAVDYGEETGEFDRQLATLRLDHLVTTLKVLCEDEAQARVVRDGLNIAIIGRPNAGKSSLFNSIIRVERAIVSSQPGTTRDTIEASLIWEQTLVRLVDTAGMRTTTDPLEQAGIERTIAAANEADAVIYVYDCQVGWTQEDQKLCDELNQEIWKVGNKVDLVPGFMRDESAAYTSAINNSGVREFFQDIVSHFLNTQSKIPIVNSRHTPLLEQAISSLLAARETVTSNMPPDLVAVDLQSAHRSLGEITGDTATPDIVEKLFKDFCIGK